MAPIGTTCMIGRSEGVSSQPHTSLHQTKQSDEHVCGALLDKESWRSRIHYIQCVKIRHQEDIKRIKLRKMPPPQFRRSPNSGKSPNIDEKIANMERGFPGTIASRNFVKRLLSCLCRMRRSSRNNVLPAQQWSETAVTSDHVHA